MIVYVTLEMYGLNADATYPKLQSLNLHGQDFEMLLPAVFWKKKPLLIVRHLEILDLATGKVAKDLS